MPYPSVLRRVLLFLALGLLATLLTTVVLSATVNIHDTPSFGGLGPTDGLHWGVSVATVFGSERVESKYQPVNVGVTKITPGELVPDWTPLGPPPAAGAIDHSERFEARGWPALCVWCRPRRATIFEDGRIQQASVTGALELPLQPWVSYSGRNEPRLLPLRPVWIGLMANTLFYALVVALLAVVMRWGRRARRFTYGLCPRCCYCMQHDYRHPCPECGWTGRRPRVAEPSP